MGIINWIDKELNEIRGLPLFKDCFQKALIEEDDGVSYLFNASKGINLILSDNFSVGSIHLFSGNNNETKRYRGVIPFDLDFSMSRTVVNRKFGSPDRKGGGYTDFLGTEPAWNKYFLENCSLHIQYAMDKNSIDFIAIASLGKESYLDIGPVDSFYDTFCIGI
jgi:hypothetical protein